MEAQNKNKVKLRKLPVCLYEPCAKNGERHFLRNYDKVPKEECEKLIKEYREKKNAAVKLVTETVIAETEENPIAFLTNFG